MSNIGKIPIGIPEGVTVDIKKADINIKGKLGEMNYIANSELKISLEDNKIVVSRPTNQKKHRELHGLTRTLIYNMVVGVSEGFSKELNLVGVGYTADAGSGKYLVLNVGYSHPIYFEQPDGITFETPKNTVIIIKGCDKQLVGQVSARIREFRKPEPYKGKGIKYSDEYIKRKAGKSVGVGA
tara:strand:- start:204 stop:752 length:549 start_codon:yes stop_codon:yes gene_type:complete